MSAYRKEQAEAGFMKRRQALTDQLLAGKLKWGDLSDDACRLVKEGHALYKLLFVLDWTGTLCSKVGADNGKCTERRLVESCMTLLHTLAEINTLPNFDIRIRILSIANGGPEAITDRKAEINEFIELASCPFKEIIKVLVISPPKVPAHFSDKGFEGWDADQVVVVGDRPAREIQVGKRAGAYTCLVRNSRVSIMTEEPLVGELDGKPYDGTPDMTFNDLAELIRWLDQWSCPCSVATFLNRRRRHQFPATAPE